MTDNEALRRGRTYRKHQNGKYLRADRPDWLSTPITQIIGDLISYQNDRKYSTAGSRKPEIASEYSNAWIDMRHDNALNSAVAAAEPGARSQAPDAVDASGIVTLRVPFRHAATSAPDAQAGPP